MPFDPVVAREFMGKAPLDSYLTKRSPPPKIPVNLPPSSTPNWNPSAYRGGDARPAPATATQSFKATSPPPPSGVKFVTQSIAPIDPPPPRTAAPPATPAQMPAAYSPGTPQTVRPATPPAQMPAPAPATRAPGTPPPSATPMPQRALAPGLKMAGGGAVVDFGLRVASGQDPRRAAYAAAGGAALAVVGSAAGPIGTFAGSVIGSSLADAAFQAAFPPDAQPDPHVPIPKPPAPARSGYDEDNIYDVVLGFTWGENYYELPIAGALGKIYGIRVGSDGNGSQGTDYIQIFSQGVSLANLSYKWHTVGSYQRYLGTVQNLRFVSITPRNPENSQYTPPPPAYQNDPNFDKPNTQTYYFPPFNSVGNGAPTPRGLAGANNSTPSPASGGANPNLSPAPSKYPPPVPSPSVPSPSPSTGGSPTPFAPPPPAPSPMNAPAPGGSPNAPPAPQGVPAPNNKAPAPPPIPWYVPPPPLTIDVPPPPKPTEESLKRPDPTDDKRPAPLPFFIPRPATPPTPAPAPSCDLKTADPCLIATNQTAGRNEQKLQQVDAKLDQLNALLGGSNLAGISGIANQNSQILSKVDGLSNLVTNNFKKTWEFLKIDRLVNLLILASTLHNALMLSSSLKDTLLAVIGEITSLFGLKDAEGQTFDFNQIINKSVEDFLKGILGAENYTSLNENWKKANRFYQATANLLSSITNLIYTVQSLIEISGSWTGKIGNALRNSLVVPINAYEQFSENLQGGGRAGKLKSVFDGIESAENVTSNISNVTGNISSVVQESQQIGNTFNEITTLANAGKTTQTNKETAQSTASTSAHPNAEQSSNPDN